jgi:hypothetical protein
MEADPLEQARIADDIEAAAYRDMYAAAPPELMSVLALRASQIEGLTLLQANGVVDPVIARVIGLGNDGRIDAPLIDRMMQTYTDAGIASYWVHVNPVLAPVGLCSLLESRGFVPAKRRTWAKMMRDNTPPPLIVTSLLVRQAGVQERVSTSTVITTAFGMPPPFTRWIDNLVTRPGWTMIAALIGKRVVGGGLLYINGSHAWLVTMAARIHFAIARGCTHIVTETSEPMDNEPNPSLRNMYRLGFTRVASRLNYVAPTIKQSL